MTRHTGEAIGSGRRVGLAGLAGALLLATVAGAADSPFDLDSAGAIRGALERHAGQRVKVRLQSGQDLEGTVTKVGTAAVHLGGLTGADFYDAVVRLDQISAVIVRARSR